MVEVEGAPVAGVLREGGNGRQTVELQGRLPTSVTEGSV